MKFFIEVNPEEVNGKVILLDVDGTLVVDDSREIDALMIQHVKAFTKNNRVFLCSNNNDYTRNNLFAELLGIDSVSGSYKKPNPRLADAAKAKLGGEFDLDVEDKPIEYLVIGDKVLIDGIFAKRINGEFLHVKRLVSGKENAITKVAYALDNLLSKFI